MYETVSYLGAGEYPTQSERLSPRGDTVSHELILVLSGTVSLTGDGRQYELKKNGLFLSEPGDPPLTRKESPDAVFFWVHFSGDLLPDPALKHQSLPKAHRLILLFRQLLFYRSEGQTGECLDYLTRLILMECFSRKESDSANRLVCGITQWINENRDRALKVESVSEHFGYNTDYISRLFKAHCDCSLKEYIDRVRLDRIKELLLSGELPLCDVAYSTGFDDYKYFLNFFKYHEGITPTQFAKAYSPSPTDQKQPSKPTCG